MQQISELTRSWSDTLTTLSVGSLAFFLPYVGRVDPDGSLSFAFGKILDFFALVENGGTVAGLLLSLMFLSLLMAIVYFMIQFGEFLSLLPDKKDGGKKAKLRVTAAAENSALMLMFSNAYTSYRLFCGIGGLLLLHGMGLFISGAFNLNIQTIASAVFCLFWGAMLVFRFSRYSFTTIDWVIFGKVEE
ncbi:MAG: hypothetical protein ACEQSU_13290 [Microgenomates group bacterium]